MRRLVNTGRFQNVCWFFLIFYKLHPFEDEEIKNWVKSEFPITKRYQKTFKPLCIDFRKLVKVDILKFEVIWNKQSVLNFNSIRYVEIEISFCLWFSKYVFSFGVESISKKKKKYKMHFHTFWTILEMSADLNRKSAHANFEKYI